MQLQNRVAIITGGETGIGRAIAKAFAREGADIVIAGLGKEPGQDAVKAIQDLGRRALFISTDVAVAGQVSAMVLKTTDSFGTVDILVNNAGVQHLDPIVNLQEQDWDKVVDVILKGTFLCSKAVLPTMLAKKAGRVINIASAHGKVGSAFKAPYVSAKHGVIGFTKVLALEVAEPGITANCICPGYVLTPLVQAQLQDQARLHGIPVEEVARDVLLKETAEKRFIDAEEVAGLAVYLASDIAKGITGQAISIDGGWVMQ